MAEPSAPMSGRRHQAARNDERILESARAVFLADPDAPISAVSRHAGVGISALYNRYASKEDLLRRLCRDGLATFIRESEAALADSRDPWTMFRDYMRRLVDAEASSLTRALAGKFAPTPELFALAEQASALLTEIFDRVRAQLRPGLEVHDISLVFELVAAVKVGDGARAAQLRRRYLEVILDGLRTTQGPPLPGPPPSWLELSERWAQV